MNLHPLILFQTVVQTGRFSKAAAELRLAQSAMSYPIKALGWSNFSPVTDARPELRQPLGITAFRGISR
jgi:hypothetical protein